ncbi:MAG: glutamate synthase subunit beta [Planctomycetota bacterium]|jgi:NAD(P)H-dependent glutamate synthase small subunit
MANARGFLEYKRQPVRYRPIKARVKDYSEIEIPLTPDELIQQAERCQDCGIPFCHGMGCPVGNLIPEFNELIRVGKWKEGCQVLHSTNNFPEITGRICPAPCETACTLAVNDDPVLIRHIEFQIVERGFQENWIVPVTAPRKSGKRVAVIGSGPAGLAAAQQLVRMGHEVVVFEKDEKPGGLLRYGIPDFKLEKWVIDRRLEQLEQEGVQFQMGVNAGIDISVHYLEKMFDCICLTMGAGQPRDLTVSGRGYDNIFFAMDYLSMQNRLNAGEKIEQGKFISAQDKNVIVVGGGDTGSDCVGTARRQNAKSITQIEILPQPPQDRPQDTPWPMWPRMMRTSSSHEEGCDRHWSVMTKRISGVGTRVSKLHCCQIKWEDNKGRWEMREIENSEFELKADLVLLAMGFVHVVHDGLVQSLQLKLDQRGNIEVNNCQTSQPWVFAAGDTVNGASLVVSAIDTGRKAAEAVDQYLQQ